MPGATKFQTPNSLTPLASDEDSESESLKGLNKNSKKISKNKFLKDRKKKKSPDAPIPKERVEFVAINFPSYNPDPNLKRKPWSVYVKYRDRENPKDQRVEHKFFGTIERANDGTENDVDPTVDPRCYQFWDKNWLEVEPRQDETLSDVRGQRLLTIRKQFGL